MTTNYVLSIDPGVSSGIALISYEVDHAPQLVRGWQFTGGVAALKGWIKRYVFEGCYSDEWGYYHSAMLNRYGDLPYGRYLLEDEREKVYNEGTDEYEDQVINPRNVTVICEKFTARATKGFSYTTATLEPLRGEGAVIMADLMPDYDPKEKRWRSPALQYLVGGKDLSDKKSRQHAFLKDSGFYLTNKDFPDSPAKDGADDFRSACSHGLAYLARELKHRPTFEMIRNWTEGNAV